MNLGHADAACAGKIFATARRQRMGEKDLVAVGKLVWGDQSKASDGRVLKVDQLFGEPNL